MVSRESEVEGILFASGILEHRDTFRDTFSDWLFSRQGEVRCAEPLGTRCPCCGAGGRGGAVGEQLSSQWSCSDAAGCQRRDGISRVRRRRDVFIARSGGGIRGGDRDNRV